MLFRNRREPDHSGLKPYVFRTQDGFLLGMGMDPKVGAPCAQCVQFWLEDRNVWVEPMALAELTLRRDLLIELIEKQNPNVLYEISINGDANKLEGPVFPHPRCTCVKSHFISGGSWEKKSCFAFSPISKLSAARYATSDGNAWITQAGGLSPITSNDIEAFGTGATKEVSRLKAVDAWLKEAARADSAVRRDLRAMSFQRPTEAAESALLTSGRYFDSFGAGETKDAAILDAVFSLTKQITIRRFSNSAKNPMLIVGVNNWLRSKVPFFILQQYDLHLLFYPNSFPCWVVGVAAFSRTRSDEKPIFVFGAHSAIHKAIDEALGKILNACGAEAEPAAAPATQRCEKGAKRVLWWTNWIYRCPKLSLKDALQLEAYEPSVELWKSYFQDGQPNVQLIELNHASLPKDVRHLVQLRLARTEIEARSIGIGTWADFRDVIS